MEITDTFLLRRNVKGHKTLIGFLMCMAGMVMILAVSRKGILVLITDNRKICIILRVVGYTFGSAAVILSYIVDDIIDK
ncbi:MAG: hypothetical protein IJ666_00670 [Ruminococcus sp.]|nr:hypothetical protein [Ruminococcus sp.]